MQIGTALSYGNSGELITVRFKDGSIQQVKAGNVINSSQVFVAEGYCWSLTSPVEQTSNSTTTRVRSRNDLITCQLVAATILRTLIDRKLVADISPYDTGTIGRERAIIPENPSWSYNATQDYCLLTDDGSGQYSSLSACYAAHKTSTPETFIGSDSLFSHNVFYDSNFDDELPTQANSFYSTGFGLYGTFRDSFQNLLTFDTVDNGDIVRFNNLFGIDADNTYKVGTRFRTGAIALDNPVWLYCEMEVRTQYRHLITRNLINEEITTEIIQATLSDGSIVCSTGTELTPLTFDGNYFNYLHSGTLAPLTVVDEFSSEHPRFSLNLPHPFYRTFSGAISYLTEEDGDTIPQTSTSPPIKIIIVYTPKVWKVRLSIDNTYFRNTTADYKTHEEITSLFVKFHDPDSKLIKVDEYEYGRTRETNFVHLGDKAYLFIKKEKLAQPNKPFEEREWFKIIVKKLTPVLQPDESYEVEIETFEYQNPEPIEEPTDNYYLKPLTNAYLLEDENPCLNASLDITYDLKDITTTFIENSFDTLKNNTNLVYEMPGYRRLAYNASNELVTFIDGRNYDDILLQDITALLTIFKVTNSETSCTYTELETDVSFNLSQIDFAAYLAQTTDAIALRYPYSFLSLRPEIIHIAIACREKYVSKLNNPKLKIKGKKINIF